MTAGAGRLSLMGDGAIGRSMFSHDWDFLVGGGEMARLIAAKDWSLTPLGAIETWPQSLRTTVSLCLASNFPTSIIWGPENTQIYNDRYRMVCGDGHPAYLGMNYAVSWASAWPAVGEAFARAKAGETSYLENQRMFLHRNGYLEEIFFTVSTSPIRDESGGIGGLFHMLTETRATMLGEAAELPLQQHDRLQVAHRNALRESESWLKFALEAGQLGSWELDLSTRAFVGSATCLETLGLAPCEHAVTYEDMLAHIYPGDRLRQRADVQTALAQRTPFDVEYRVLSHDGEIRWVQLRGRGIYDEAGTAIRMIGVSLEVTPRKRADAQQKLLLDELNHRVKNTLATVQAIAMQTQRHAGDNPAFLRDLEGRIGALARAHDLLTEASWAGASLAEIVGQTVAAYDSEDAISSRLTVAGPPVTLSPNAAVTLNMAFHELTTNAAKYGSLSVPVGRVDIVWRGCGEMGAREVEIIWREAGGPAVMPPAQRGFGSRLLERGLARELGGDVKLAFLPAGLECRMRLPVSAKIGFAASVR